MSYVPITVNNIEQCGICLEDIEDRYAKPGNEIDINAKYHIYCLERWFSYSRRGITSHIEETNYVAYNSENRVIETIRIDNRIEAADENRNSSFGSTVKDILIVLFSTGLAVSIVTISAWLAANSNGLIT